MGNVTAGRKNKFLTAGAVFLAVMLFFTLFGRKLDNAMMPKVYTALPRQGAISLGFSAYGAMSGEQAVFNIPLSQDAYIGVRDTVEVEFANVAEIRNAKITEKIFDADTQTVTVYAAFSKPPEGVYDGQRCGVTFYFDLGEFNSVLPRGCIFYEDGGAYIYRVNEERSVLGERQTVSREQVSVLAENEYYAAVSGASYAEYVRHTNKPLNGGMRVTLLP